MATIKQKRNTELKNVKNDSKSLDKKSNNNEKGDRGEQKVSQCRGR